MSGKNWSQEEFNKDHDTKIKPIELGTKFQFKIRFENLSDIELGALIRYFD